MILFKRRFRIQLSVLMLFVLLGYLAFATTLPSPMYHASAGSESISCCGRSVQVFDPMLNGVYYDYNSQEVAACEAWFISQYQPYCLNITAGTASAATNCHAYAFGVSKWFDNPDTFLGTTTGCYKVDNSGEIFRFSSHSALAGPSSIDTHGPCVHYYKAKCSHGPVAAHDNCVYGIYSSRWKKIQ